MSRTPDQHNPTPADDERGRRGVSRRGLLQGAAAASLGLGATDLATGADADAHPALSARRAPRTRSRTPGTLAAPAISGIHLQFGAHPAREMVVTWQSYGEVSNPRVELHSDRGRRLGPPVAASTRTYSDARDLEFGTEPVAVYVHSAHLTGLWPDTDYVYVIEHDGADPEIGDFRTAPEGRAPFTFTSYGDQGTPTTTAPTNQAAPAPAFKNDNLGSPAAGDVTAGVEKVAPLFHLVNGDLCYANLSNYPVRTWSDWMNNNSRSARYRAWMPTAGNHENEALGAHGFEAYQTYFDLPSNGAGPDLEGLWYSFRVGSVKVICLNNDDVCLQDAGSSYVHGYSGGAQKRWLASELAHARGDRSIDWIVVCMHQVAMSTAQAPPFNGADIGIRREWLPLFDRYAVDLVVCGHEHHYERMQPVRGATNGSLLTPRPVAERDDVIDTTRGTVHLIIGGGGTSAPSNQLLTTPPVCQVITSVGPDRSAPSPPSAPNGHLVSHYTQEDAIWATEHRDEQWAYGFAAFEVDPGHRPGGRTSIGVTYYRVKDAGGKLEPWDSFTLVRPRRDG